MKDALVSLSIKSIQCEGEYSDLKSVDDITPNGTPESIHKWAEVAFTSLTTWKFDKDQK
jgi:hypothetical protein